MGNINKSYTFATGTTILAEEHNTNFDTLYNWANGNVSNSNITASAGIELTKLLLSDDATFSGDLIFSGAIRLGTANQGDIWYDNGTSMTRLPPGISGQYLQTQGAAANPTWETPVVTPGVPAGTMFPSIRSTAPSGYILCVGETIGNAASGADHASADYETLFDIVKDADPNAGTEVFADGDTVVLPDMRGRGFVGLDNMGGSSADVITASEADTLGDEYGVETHSLVTAEMPSHTHTIPVSSGSKNFTGDTGGSATSSNGTTGSTGSGTAHQNVQPSLFGSWIIKY